MARKASANTGEEANSQDLIADAISSFKKEFGTEGEGSVQTLDDVKRIPYYVHSGSKFLDKLISGKLVNGGYPAGRIVEIYGDPSHGKTTLAVHALAAMQRMGGLAILFDTESAIDPVRTADLGVDPSKLLVAKARTVEKVFETIEKLIDSIVEKKLKALVVWDSLAATTTEKEDENEYGQAGMSIHARLLSQALRKIVSKIEDADVCLVLLNQLKVNPMDPYSDATLGGKAPKFHASVRLHVKKRGDIKETVETEMNVKHQRDKLKSVGIKVEVVSTKNKITSPFRDVELTLFHKTGLDDDRCILEFLETYINPDTVDKETGKGHPYVTASGAWRRIKFNDKEISFYPNQFSDKLKEVEGLRDYVNDIVDRFDLIEKRILTKDEFNKQLWGSTEEKA